MSTQNTLPLDLFKANLELQLRVCRLLQITSAQWLENASRVNKESVAESDAEIESVLKAPNWQALAMQPGETFWRQFRQRIGDAQGTAQVAINAKTEFTKGLQEAIQEWQRTGVEALGGRTDLTRPFNDLFKQWGAAWTLAAASGDKAAKGSLNRD